MIYGALLGAHLVGACATGIAASYAGIAMWYGRDRAYRSVALVLGILASFEILTGTALSIISLQITSLALCANIAVYLSIVFFVEALLFYKMKKTSISFPVNRTLSPIAAALAFFAVALACGF